MERNISFIKIMILFFIGGLQHYSMATQEIQQDSCMKNNNTFSNQCGEKLSMKQVDKESNQNSIALAQYQNPVKTYHLKNGMAVLIRELHTIPKVSLQLWYNVGSKDERDGERGLAHLIEHMVFKGTEKLSESDIDTITRKLSGNCNAFTHYDFTGYLFNLPSQNWKKVLPVMADCMENCSFNEQMLNSEMKAVIQELKMYRDNYIRTVIDEQIGIIFHDHPYHHPVIGYKQDLWTVNVSDLHAFYKKHYIPNNAALVVVGDVNADDAFAAIAEYFEQIPANTSYKKPTTYHSSDIASRAVTIYRDVKQPTLVYTFVVPGLSNKNGHILSLVDLIIGSGRQSRLYKKLVDGLQIATSASSFSEELFDHSLFFIIIEPKTVGDIEKVRVAVEEELRELGKFGVTGEELARAIKQTKMGLYNLFEDIEEQAFEIGKYFIATGDPNYIFNYLNYPQKELSEQVNAMISQYLRPTVMHVGTILPLPKYEQSAWKEIQKDSDKEDQQILSARPRDIPIEPARYANDVVAGEHKPFSYPKAVVASIDNGFKVFYYNNPNTPKIDLLVEFLARPWYDAPEKQGMYNFVTQMMVEGTTSFPGSKLMEYIESRGMTLSVYPGGICMSLLSEDLPSALMIVKEVCTQSTFPVDAVEKVRAKILAKIDKFWDEPNSFVSQLVNEIVYKGHPYSQDILGSKVTISSLTRDDLVAFYKQIITPEGARVALVGDLSVYDVPKEIASVWHDWKNSPVKPLVFPTVKPTESQLVNHYINRDQVVLCFAALSVDRKHPDFDKLHLFDQILGGGVLGASLGSRLFKIREQSGLFYTINGSLVAGANKQPGKFLIKTIVSLDRLDEAERVIKETVATMVPTITQKELEEAKDAIISGLISNFASNAQMAAAFLFLDYYGFPNTFFDNRAKELAAISLDQMKESAAKIMRVDNLLTVRVGRVHD